MSAVGGFLQTA